jgi:uncharacterized protein (DUF488 family)
MELFTVGHGTAVADDLARLLTGAGVGAVVDVRIAPGSKRNPDMDRSAMTGWLPAHGVAYRWEKRLGGRRSVPPDSPDVALRNRAFAGYAAHMRTAEFAAALDDVLAGAATVRTAVLCSESVWWRCHRRMIADAAVLTRDVAVRHLMHDGRLQEHPPTDGVRRRDDGLLVYDGGQGTLPVG